MLFGRKNKETAADIEIGEELDGLPGGGGEKEGQIPPSELPPPALPTAPGPLIENPAHFDARMQRIETGLSQIQDYLISLTREAEAVPAPSGAGPTFYEQLIDHGEDAILNNPRIMGAIENRLRGQSEFDAARRELANQLPEAYDPTSPIHRTREALRSQFEQLGVHASVLNSRLFEELFTNAAIGRNIDTVISSRQKSGLTPQTFVEAPRNPTPGGAFGELTAEQLGAAEQRTADRFGVSPADYAKNLNRMIQTGVIERR